MTEHRQWLSKLTTSTLKSYTSRIDRSKPGTDEQPDFQSFCAAYVSSRLKSTLFKKYFYYGTLIDFKYDNETYCF